MKVQETKIGNSVIEIYDDSIPGPEEVEKILKRSGITRAGEREPPVQMVTLDQKSKKKEVKLA